MHNPTHDSNSFLEAQKAALRAISTDEFRNFGINHIAYIRPVLVMGKGAYAIFNADGTPLAALENLEQAVLAARQNDLEPVIVH